MDPLATITGNDDSEKFEVHALAEIDEALRRIAEASDPDVPPLATVLRQDGDQLTIGLGRPFNVLTYIAQDLDPPYFTSLGNENARGSEDFFLQGHHTEFRHRSLVPLDDAVALAVERRLGQDAADVAEEFLVRAGAEGAVPPGFQPLLGGDGPLMPPEV